jgi:hypothetical protein
MVEALGERSPPGPRALAHGEPAKQSAIPAHHSAPWLAVRAAPGPANP